jgi:hypothetical protein
MCLNTALWQADKVATLGMSDDLKEEFIEEAKRWKTD